MRVSAPAILLAVPFLTGAATAILAFDGLNERFAVLAAASALLALIAATASALQGDPAGACGVAVLGCALAGLSLGASAARNAYHPPLLQWFEQAAPDGPTVIEGVLREDASPSPLGASLTLDVLTTAEGAGGTEPLGGVRIAVGGVFTAREIDRWRAGRTIRAPVFLRRPSTYINPGTPDEQRALAVRGIVLVGSVKSAALVDVERTGNRVSEAAAAVRAWTRARIHAHMPFDRRTAGVTAAVLIGDRSGLAQDDERRLQEAGTYHVVAISGGNVAILAVLGMLLCRAVLLPGPAAAAMTAAFLLFYGVVAGGAASVARAVTVAALLLGARTLDHRGASLNVLAIAAIIAVAASPAAILDAGFILSFAATFGILAGVPLIVPVQHTRDGPTSVIPRGARAAAAVFAATICAEIVLAPVSATLFGRVPFAGLILNFAAIPLMTIVQVAGLMVALVSPVSSVAADWAGLVAHLGALALIRSASLVELMPWLSADVRPPGWPLIAAYYASALALLIPSVRRMAAWTLAASALVLFIGPRHTSRDVVPSAPVPVRAVILDVGQGDATAIQLPGGRALLVDTGGLAAFPPIDTGEPSPTFDVGERVVWPALRALGVSELHALLITHADPDHMLGAPGILRHVSAASVWEGIPVPPHGGLKALASFAAARGMTWRTIQAGDAERFGEVEVRVLHPGRPDWERQRVRNDDSIVLEIRTGRVSIILPGDIGREGEHAILKKLESGRLTILKAPHHGSATSSTSDFVEAARPAAVIFSCGRDNRFGHPHPTVVRRYQELGAEIFSTAHDGAVFVETDGTTVEVRGWKGRTARFTAGDSP